MVSAESPDSSKGTHVWMKHPTSCTQWRDGEEGLRRKRRWKGGNGVEEKEEMGRRDGVNVTMATMIVREEGHWMVIGLLKHTSGCLNKYE